MSDISHEYVDNNIYVMKKMLNLFFINSFTADASTAIFIQTCYEFSNTPHSSLFYLLFSFTSDFIFYGERKYGGLSRIKCVDNLMCLQLYAWNLHKHSNFRPLEHLSMSKYQISLFIIF